MLERRFFLSLVIAVAAGSGVVSEAAKLRASLREPKKGTPAREGGAEPSGPTKPSWVPGRSSGLAAPGTAPPAPSQPRLSRQPMPADQPGEAMRFFAEKRAPDGGRDVPVERYLPALAHLDDMPRYSTARGVGLPSRRQERELGAPSPDVLGTWTPLGPGNVGGRTRGLVIHPTTTTTMWAAGVAGGVWKSTDAGASWTPKSDLISNIAVCSLAIDPASPLVLYAGTGEGYFNSDAVRGLGIFKSTDGGETWSHLATTGSLSFSRVNDLVVTPSGGRVYAATRADSGTSGIWRSTNGGTSWTQVYSSSVTGGVTDLAIRTDATGMASDYVFAAQGNFTAGAILRNTDAAGAGTWDTVYTEGSTGRCSLAIAPSSQSTVFALCAQSSSGTYLNGLKAVLRSTSGGDLGTWTVRVDNTDPTVLNTLLLSNPVYGAGGGPPCPSQVFLNQGWYDNVIAVDPLDPSIVWTGGVDLMRSTDGGMSWGVASYWWVNPPSAHADQHTIVFHPGYNGTSNQTMYVGNDGGIYRTDNARGTTSTTVCSYSPGTISWTSLNNGYGVTQFYHGTVYPSGTQYFGGTQDNGTVGGADGGPNSWTSLLGGDGGYVAVDPTDRGCPCGTPCYLFGETTELSLRRSTNCGTSFSSVTSGITEASSNFQFIAPFWMDPTNPARLYIGGRRMWRTTNSGGSWTQASTTDNFGASPSGEVAALATAPTDADRAVAGTVGGTVFRTAVATTADSTTAWSSSVPRSSARVSWLTFDPTSALTVYATYSAFNGASTGHVFKSTDAGATWAGLDGSGGTAIPDIPVHCLVVDPTDTARLFAGTDLGVFTSTDGGGTWMVENTGFANVVVEAMTLQGTTLFAFTHGRGAWKVALAPGPNTPPGITAAGPVTRQQGSPGTASTVATVTDTESGAGSITVTQIAGGTATGVTLTGITNTAGTVTATVTASCTATSGTVRLQATDPLLATSTADLTVTVTPNSPPALGTYPATQVNAGAGTTVTPSAAPTDNGSVSTVTASAPGFTGSFAGNPSTGVITVSSAGPAGAHTVTVTATDSCGATTTSTFTLTVNGAPTLTAGSAITRQQGSAGSTATIGTASDDLTAPGSLTVTQIAGGTATGISVTGLTNTAGTVTASVAASCTATSGTVRFQVMDGGGLSSTTDVTVTVTPNAPPVLGTYPSTLVNVTSGGTVTPSAAPTDNGSVSSVTASAPGFTGGLSGSSTTGVITVTSAGPPGVHTVTVTATDSCGATSTGTFTLTVNGAPGLTSGGMTRPAGSSAGSVTIGTVSDDRTAAASLAVAQVAGGTATGVTLSGLTNTAGSVSAMVATTCAATSGTVKLQVTDGDGLSATFDVTVTVTANTPPSLGTYPATGLSAGGSGSVTPSAAPADNGSVDTVTATAPGFTGTLTGNAGTGVISVTSAGPVGPHTVTVTATDSCGSTSTATFTLTVTAVNTAPGITASPGGVSRQQGSAATSATIAAVTDAESSPGSLTVTEIAGGTATGITLSGITNTAGTVTAMVAASCAATSGTVRLQVSDGGLSATADLSVTVTPNTPPVLGTYPPAVATSGGGTTVTPSAAPTDNGSLATLTASAPGFTGTLTGSSTTGVVTVSGAGPVGPHTVTVTATDSCGSTSAATFTLTVSASNTAPGIAAGGPLSRSRGAAGTASTIATVTDLESPAGSLTVTAPSVPSGLSLTGITNTAGTVSGTVAAGCTAALGTQLVTLEVSDGSLTSTSGLTVNVTANASGPVVTPPSPAAVAVNQTSCLPAGATLATLLTRFPSQHALLDSLLNGGSAVDDCTPSPSRLATQLDGADVTNATVFPVGPSAPAIRYVDADANVGTASVSVRVRRQGDVTDDGVVDVNDLITVANLIVGNVTAGSPPYASPLLTGDVDGNGVVDVFDLVTIANFVVGNVACLAP